MAIALLTSVKFSSTGSATSGNIDTSGANFIIAVHGDYVAGTFSDSKSNTWTPATIYTSPGMDIVFYYAKNATVGTGHNFSSTSWGRFMIASFSGVNTSAPFDQENGAGGLSQFTPGSITPSVNNCLVVAGCAEGAMDGSSAASGMTIIIENADGGGGQPGGTALAYVIQTTASAINPTWSGGPNGVGSLNIASFKEASGGGAASEHDPSLSPQRRAILAR